MQPILTITARELLPLSGLKARQERLQSACDSWGLKGSIALSPEGINVLVAGEASQVELLLAELRTWDGLASLAPQVSGTERPPFRQMRVRVKHRILASTDPRIPRAQATQCSGCRLPLSEADRRHRHYEAGKCCPYCFRASPEHMASTLADRQQQLSRIIVPLPGSLPRDHFRPISIPADCDGQRLLDVLCRIISHVPARFWLDRCAQELLLDPQGQPCSPEKIVRSGELYQHRFPAQVEPDVDMQIELLYEDAAFIVLNKPAPLPMHAGGRFHRNTLKYVLDALYHPQQLRPSHRLDANTTGTVVVARTQYIARKIQTQFARGEVEKLYLVRVQGHPAADEFSCDAPISAAAGELGSRSIDYDAGLAARTEFRVQQRLEDGTTLLEARPLTGRTNQIRVHLWHLGLPVCGDPAYRVDKTLGDHQTRHIDAPPLCLHAWCVSFRHPVHGEQMTFTAPPPAWMNDGARAGNPVSR